MTPPLVSVVVPTHNRARLLPRVVASILAQDVADIELVIVDDGSSDRTQDVLAGIGDARLRTLRHDSPSGVSRARNAGTTAATGRWVAWCDDDDLWAPHKIRLQLEALALTPGARWCSSGAAHIDGALQVRSIRLAPPTGDVSQEILRSNLVPGGGSGVLADRGLVLSLGGFNPRLSIYADWEMWARLAQASPLASVDEPLVGYYLDHPDGMSHNRRKLLSEFDDLRPAFAPLAESTGQAASIDARQLGAWMLSQQVSVGSPLATSLLAGQLLRRRMIKPWRVPYSLVGSVVSPDIRRHWARRRAITDPRRLRYEASAEEWLSGMRRSLSASPLADG